MFLAPGAAARRPTLAAVPGLIPSPPPPPPSITSRVSRSVKSLKQTIPVPCCSRGRSRSREPGSELAAHRCPPPCAPSPRALDLGAEGRGSPGTPRLGRWLPGGWEGEVGIGVVWGHPQDPRPSLPPSWGRTGADPRERVPTGYAWVAAQSGWVGEGRGCRHPLSLPQPCANWWEMVHRASPHPTPKSALRLPGGLG